jgi:hypothetical protein
MRKLELKDIVGYLPYDLQVYNEQQDSKIDTIIGIFQEKFDFEHWSPLNSDIENYKPILRPMSDLTKSIVVKGYNDDKKFVPIVALAERSFEIEIDAVTGFAQNGKCRGVSFIFDYVEYGFSYSEDTDSFHTQIISPKQNIIADNQSQLFDLLNQWHFDYRNLIEDGLAVDINTIN